MFHSHSDIVSCCSSINASSVGSRCFIEVNVCSMTQPPLEQCSLLWGWERGGTFPKQQRVCWWSKPRGWRTGAWEGFGDDRKWQVGRAPRWFSIRSLVWRGSTFFLRFVRGSRHTAIKILCLSPKDYWIIAILEY